MKKYNEEIKRAGATLFMFLMFYALIAIRSYGVIKDFNYIGGFLMIMGAAVFFTTLEVLMMICYNIKLKKANEEKKSQQFVVKIKTIYGSLFVVWLILVGFTYVAIVKALGWRDLPGNKTLLIAAVCSLVIAVLVISIFNHFRAKQE